MYCGSYLGKVRIGLGTSVHKYFFRRLDSLVSPFRTGVIGHLPSHLARAGDEHRAAWAALAWAVQRRKATTGDK
jgi:hypothetical protein